MSVNEQIGHRRDQVRTSLQSYLSGKDRIRFMNPIQEKAQVPTEHHRSQNHLNPINPITDIGYLMPDVGLSLHTSLKMYYIFG